MKVTEAIEIMEGELEICYESVFTKKDIALKLGIEALKRINELRTPSSGNPHLQLPGETEEKT